MSTGLIAGGSLAGIIVALFIVFEKVGKAIDFSASPSGGEPAFLIPAMAAFAAMALALLAVAMLTRQTVADSPEGKDRAILDEIDH